MHSNFWQRRRVFVTGATGLLGSAVVARLLADGADVTCLVRDWIPESRAVGEGHFARANLVPGDLTDFACLLRALNEFEIDTVLHLGAQTIVGTAARSALSTFESNVRGTWNLLEAARLCGNLVERIVVASSDKAYGEQPQLPYTEDMPPRGRYPYDVSKACADLIALSYFHTYQLPVAVTRCGNLYGPGDLNFSRLVPGTIRSALADQPPVIRSDGQYVRDYFYVADAAEAYLRLAESMPSAATVGRAFNFGTETPMSVIELVERIVALAGRPHLKPQILNQASREIRRQFLDCSRAREVLAWQPRYTLDEGLRETISWYRAHLS